MGISRQKRKAQRDLDRKARATSPAAYQSARDLAALAGPDGIANEYEAPGTEQEIARGFARAAYHEQVWADAERGALDGFREYAAA